MREIPFENPAANAAGTDAEPISLLDRIKMATRSHNEPSANENAEENKSGHEPDGHEPDGKPEEEPSVTFDETETDDPEEEAARKIEEVLMENPEELAELLVELGNVVRIIFGPGIYEGLMYPGQERNDIRGVIAKSIANEKDNKPPTEGMNNYEKRLYEKWPKLQESIQNISFTEEQVKKLAKYMGQDIARVGVPEWIDKHRWVLYWVSIELGKSRNIVQGRVSDAFAKKWGFG